MPHARTLLALGAAAALAVGAVHAQTTAAGFTPGTFNVDEGGAATYTIPIAVPPGIAGMQPKLDIVHSSRGANGRLGVGWALTGLSAIARCPKTLARDGESGGVNISAEDRFCLDGQRLMKTSTGSYGAVGTTYATERENFSRITAKGVSNGNIPPDWFEVRTKSGLIIEYGNSANSKFGPQGAFPAVWGVSKISDTKGNYLTVTYGYDNQASPSDWWPLRIDYTFNPSAGVAIANQSIIFEYDPEPRPDVVPMYIGGTMTRTTNRLSRIKTNIQNTLVREYRLKYNEDGNPGTPARSRLTSVQECDGLSPQSCVPATRFTLQTSTAAGLSGGSGGWWSNLMTNDTVATTIVGDFNADGKTDLLGYKSGTTWRLCLSTGTSFSCSLTSAHGGGETNNIVGDFDGDGRTDIAGYTGSGSLWHVCLSTGTGFNCAYWTGHGGGAINNVTADFDGDGRSDIAGYTGSNGVWHVCLSTGGGFNCNYWNGHSGAVENNVTGDFDGDGKSDMAGYTGSEGVWHMCLSTGSGFNCATYWIAQDAVPSRIVTGDFNGDGKTDLAAWTDNGTPQWHVCLSLGHGFACDWPNLFATAAADTIVGDFNGDGRTDLAARATHPNWQVCYGLYASGTSFSCGPQPSNVWPTVSPVRAGDFNGDGLTDLTVYHWMYSADAGSPKIEHLNVGLAAALYPDLITKVTNGLGHETTISYLPLTNSAVYTKDSGADAAVFPDVDFQGPLQVVRTASSANGIGGWISTDYLYGGAKVNARDGYGFKGFRWREVAAPQPPLGSGIKTRAHYRQDHPYIGLPSMVKRTHPNSTVLLQSGNEYGCKDFVLASGCVPAPGKRYFPYVSQSAERAKDLNGADFPMVSTMTQYDGSGNATTVTTNAADGFTKVTTNTYADPDTTNWILGRLLRTTVQSTIPTVNPPPAPPSPSVSLSPTPLTISSGTSGGTATGTSTATTTGGMPPFTYSWTPLTTGGRISVSGKQTGTFSATVSTGENFTETFRLTATDADGTALPYVDLSVTAAGPAGPPPPSVTTTPTSPMFTNWFGYGTRTRTVTANVSNGAPPFTYAWIVLPDSQGQASISNAQSQTATLSLTVPPCLTVTGRYRVTVTDSLNRSAAQDVTWTLNSTKAASGTACQ
jgi:hypothetical protein